MALWMAGCATTSPPPVAEGPVQVEGAIPRVLDEDQPVPLRTGESGYDLVTYSESDPFTPHHRHAPRPDGIRLLTIRPLW